MTEIGNAGRNQAVRLEILLVEDDLVDVALSREGLREIDAHYVTFESADSVESARDHLTRKRFDAVLLDLQLRDESGLACLHRIQEVAPKVATIVLTGDDEVAMQALQAGAQDYLTKRASPDLILRTIRHAVERQRSQEMLLRQEAELRQAQKLEGIGQLSAGIAHEINTPMQFIGDNLSFLADLFAQIMPALRALEAVRSHGGWGEPELLIALEETARQADIAFLIEEGPKALAQSQEGVDRVTKIVRAMKEFSHPGAAEKKPVDLRKAISSTVTVCSNEWKDVATVETEFDPEVPEVPCFPGDLNQVILNLVVNAAHAIGDTIDAATGERGTIRVQTRRDGDDVEIRISDTGTGIPESIRDRVFDPFFTSKEVGRGTGQGLAVAYAIVVEKHGGKIFFETKTGKGTTFVIRLPLGSAVEAGGIR